MKYKIGFWENSQYEWKHWDVIIDSKQTRLNEVLECIERQYPKHKEMSKK